MPALRRATPYEDLTMDERSCLYLEMKVLAGTDIAEAAMEACALAFRIRAGVDFMFNGVRCMAHPGADWTVLVANWRAASDRGGQYPMANAYPRSTHSAEESSNG